MTLSQQADADMGIEGFASRYLHPFAEKLQKPFNRLE